MPPLERPDGRHDPASSVVADCPDLARRRTGLMASTTDQTLLAVGQSLARVDGPAKVTGSMGYTAGISLPGMLRARVLRSPLPHARIRSIDASRAERLPGIIVLTRDDLAGMDPHYGSVVLDQPIVAVDRVRHVGDPVAAVAAPDLDDADEALDLIDVDYEPLPSVADPIAAMAPDAPILHDRTLPRPDHYKDPNLLRYQVGGNVLMTFHVAAGDIELGFDAADETFEDTYTTPVAQHAHMEPHAATAHWDAAGRLVLYTPCQNPWIVRDSLARLFGMPGSKVRLIVPPIGGGYGAKTHPRLEPLVAALARKAGRPVQLVLTREEVFATAVRHAAVVRLRTGVRRDGTLVARQVEAIYDTGAYAHSGPITAKNGGVVAAGPYRIEHVDLTSHCVYTNKAPAGPFRGFGVAQVCWAYEQQMDDIAARLGMDAVELRRKNLLRDGDISVTGQPFVAIGTEECLDSVARDLGWDGTANAPPTSPDPAAHLPDRVRGKGVAVTLKTTMTPSNSASSVRLNADGTATVLTSSTEMGQGVQTSLAQIAAEVLGIAPSAIVVTSADTDVTPYDSSTSSSRTTFSMGRAVREAAAEVRRQLADLASETLEAPPTDIEIRDGAAFVRGSPDRSIGIPDLFRARFGQPIGNLFGAYDFQTRGGLDHEGKGIASVFYTVAATGAEVEVDTGTGKVSILRLATSLDVGKAINPRQCDLQNEGSMIMGLSTALFEEMTFDNGQPTNSSFVDYGLATMVDHPAEFRSILVEHPHPDGPFGAKGAGEGVIPTVAPAIANAVARALGGARVHDMPLLPHRVLAAIDLARSPQPASPAEPRTEKQ
jgi:CO/xanthine dehydrogenase Mo-binding subunit